MEGQYGQSPNQYEGEELVVYAPVKWELTAEFLINQLRFNTRH